MADFFGSDPPIVVALDIPTYAVPGQFDSNCLVPGSNIIDCTLFGGCPFLTGPALRPWHV